MIYYRPVGLEIGAIPANALRIVRCNCVEVETPFPKVAESNLNTSSDPPFEAVHRIGLLSKLFVMRIDGFYRNIAQRVGDAAISGTELATTSAGVAHAAPLTTVRRDGDCEFFMSERSSHPLAIVTVEMARVNNHTIQDERRTCSHG